MKKPTILILIILFLASYGLSGQTTKKIIVYTYDAAGNRETRKMTEIPISSKAKEDSTYLTPEDLAKKLEEMEKQFEFEKLAEGKIKIFPNPTQGALMIKLENISNVDGICLQLHNTKGNLLLSHLLDSNYSEFDMSSFPPGLYILSVIRQDEKLQYKIIKK